MQLKPLTPLEARCYAALDAFQKQHGRLPTHRELANTLGIARTSDVLHRLVCKGWLETDKLPAPPLEPKPKCKHAPRIRRRAVKPTGPTFIPKTTDERISVVLVREIRDRLAAGMSMRDLRRECGVQHGQLQQLFENGTSLRAPALDRLCAHLKLELVPPGGDQKAYAGLHPTAALRKAIADERAAGASLNEICRAANVTANKTSGFALDKCSLNLKTVDALCGVLGLELQRKPERRLLAET